MCIVFVIIILAKSPMALYHFSLNLLLTYVGLAVLNKHIHLCTQC
mgnify:CR=1 FL=1